MCRGMRYCMREKDKVPVICLVSRILKWLKADQLDFYLESSLQLQKIT
jgi:hypothetical protein